MKDWKKEWELHKEKNRLKYMIRYQDDVYEFIMNAKLQQGMHKILENVINFGFQTIPQKVKHFRIWFSIKDETYEFIKMSTLDLSRQSKSDWILRPQKGQETWHLDLRKRRDLSEILNTFPFESYCNERND